MAETIDLIQPDRGQDAISIHLVARDGFDAWAKQLSAGQRSALAAQKFDGGGYQTAIVPVGDGWFAVGGVAKAAGGVAARPPSSAALPLRRVHFVHNPNVRHTVACRAMSPQVPQSEVRARAERMELVAGGDDLGHPRDDARRLAFFFVDVSRAVSGSAWPRGTVSPRRAQEGAAIAVSTIGVVALGDR